MNREIVSAKLTFVNTFKSPFKKITHEESEAYQAEFFVQLCGPCLFIFYSGKNDDEQFVFFKSF